jgi:hypothetical protein
MRTILELGGCVLLGIVLMTMGLSPRLLKRFGEAVGELAATCWPWFPKPKDLRIEFAQSRWLIVVGAAYIVATAAAYFSR